MEEILWSMPHLFGSLTDDRWRCLKRIVTELENSWITMSSTCTYLPTSGGGTVYRSMGVSYDHWGWDRDQLIERPKLVLGKTLWISNMLYS